jgi:ABC-2 type transport system ATP-binding protein
MQRRNHRVMRDIMRDIMRDKQALFPLKRLNSMPRQERSAHPDAEVLQVDGLCKKFGAKVAVADVSFSVRRGEIVGLLGPNGAGKTTAISMILGVLEPTSGTVRIAGRDVMKRRAKALGSCNFAAVYASLPGNLTVEENLRVFGLMYSVSGLPVRLAELLRQFDLEGLRNTKCGLLSSGESSRVSLAKALLNRPELLLLDEPTASLDPSSAQDARRAIRQLAEQGKCGILWTSHNMAEVEEVCDRVLFLSRGRILLEGDPRQLPERHGASDLEELFIRIAREPLDATLGARAVATTS